MNQLRNQGVILGEDNEKMSKSRGNVAAPDDLVKKYGADTVRTYLMFVADWAQGGPWNNQGIEGPARWLSRVWNLVVEPPAANGAPPAGDERELRRATHQTIRRVSSDMEAFAFNTIPPALMEFTNALYKHREALRGTPAWEEAVTSLLLLMAPVTPHIAEELWARLGRPYSIHQQAWPQWDAALAAEDVLTIVVQVNGKLRDRVQVPAEAGEETVKSAALATEGARKALAGQTPSKVIYVPGRLVNIVV
jgi:leucyl-tRNA synthetase